MEPTQPLLGRAYQMAPDVVQLEDTCRPGKTIAFGTKLYQPRALFNQCGASHWDGSGCRIVSRSVGSATTVFEVFPFKPRFLSFPSDARVTTADSNILPSTTGEPTVGVFLSTPSEMYHVDSAPVRTTDSRVCGWIITRTWTIRAQYHDCPEGVPRGSPVSTSQDQLIFISDVTPPVLLPVPQNVRLPFFSNFETTSTIPSTDDPVSPHFRSLNLVSTPVQMTSHDSGFVRTRRSTGFGTASTEDECKAWVATIGAVYTGGTVCGGNECAPRGCYVWAGSERVYWNNRNTGPCTAERNCLEHDGLAQFQRTWTVTGATYELGGACYSNILLLVGMGNAFETVGMYVFLF